jgi:hypothetical protein
MIGTCQICGEQVRSDVLAEWQAVKHLDAVHPRFFPADDVGRVEQDYLGGRVPSLRRARANAAFNWECALHGPDWFVDGIEEPF